MFNINRVPQSVLRRILGFAVNVEIGKLDDWLSLVPLVGVCQQWSFILCPVVYSRVFIWYTSQHYMGDCRRQGWQTNVDFIAIRGFHGFAKRWELCIGELADALMILKTVENILQFGIYNWSSINAINIVVDETIHYSKPAIASPSYARVQAFSHNLISHMPNVVSLNVSQFGVVFNFQLVIRILVDAYAMQLQWLDVHAIALSLAPHMGSQLVHLCIEFTNRETDSTIASICAVPLKYLRLINWPSKMTWHPFYTATKPGIIDFKNLSELYITYAYTEKVECSYVYNIVFPKLKCLLIDNCPQSCDIMFAKFPCMLELFRLDGELTNISKWRNIQLKSSKLLVVSHLAETSSAEENTEIANNLFEKSANYTLKSLVLKGKIQKLDIYSVNWSNLNKLDIWTPIDLAKLLNLLSRIPRLIELAVAIIELESQSMTAELINKYFDEYYDNLSHRININKLSLFEYSNLSNFHSLLIISNFIMRAELLTKLTIPAQTVAKVGNIVYSRESNAPHLPFIKIIEHQPHAVFHFFN